VFYVNLNRPPYPIQLRLAMWLDSDTFDDGRHVWLASNLGIGNSIVWFM
jgi:hypothetical protein